MNGAATNPDCHVLAYAGAQVKKGLDIAKKLGAENFGMRNLILFRFCKKMIFVMTLDYLSCQCFGEEEKAFIPSIILMLLLN